MAMPIIKKEWIKSIYPSSDGLTIIPNDGFFTQVEDILRMDQNFEIEFKSSIVIPTKVTHFMFRNQFGGGAIYQGNINMDTPLQVHAGDTIALLEQSDGLTKSFSFIGNSITGSISKDSKISRIIRKDGKTIISIVYGSKLLQFTPEWQNNQPIDVTVRFTQNDFNSVNNDIETNLGIVGIDSSSTTNLPSGVSLSWQNYPSHPNLWSLYDEPDNKLLMTIEQIPDSGSNPETYSKWIITHKEQPAFLGLSKWTWLALVKEML